MPQAGLLDAFLAALPGEATGGRWRGREVAPGFPSMLPAVAASLAGVGKIPSSTSTTPQVSCAGVLASPPGLFHFTPLPPFLPGTNQLASPQGLATEKAGSVKLACISAAGMWDVQAQPGQALGHHRPLHAPLCFMPPPDRLHVLLSVWCQPSRGNRLQEADLQPGHCTRPCTVREA